MHTQRPGSIQALLALCLFLLSLSSVSFANPAHLTEATQPNTASMHCQGCPHPAEAELDCCLHMQSCSSCIILSQTLRLTLLSTGDAVTPAQQSKRISRYYPPHTPPPKQLL